MGWARSKVQFTARGHKNFEGKSQNLIMVMIQLYMYLSSNYSLKRMKFIVYKLYFSKPGILKVTFSFYSNVIKTVFFSYPSPF